MNQINAYLQQEAQAWVTQFIEDRVAYLRSRNIKASGDLQKSLAAEVLAATRAEGVKVLVAFEEYGRIIDMRRFDPPEGGGDYLLALQDWIRRKGLEQKFIRGYMRRRKLKKVPERVLTYIAWGIARKRFNGKYRRRRWYNKSKSRAITELFRDVAANMPEQVAEEIKRSMSSDISQPRRGGRSRNKSGRITYQEFRENLNRLNNP
jgi:hypothetical protein